MIWRPLFLCCLYAAVNARTTDKCVVGEWGPMSDWSSPSCKHTQTQTGQGEVYASSHGESNRHKMKKIKQEAARKRADCKRDPNCPLTVTKSRSRTDCTDGMAGPYQCSDVNLMSEIGFFDLCGGAANFCGIDLADITGADTWGWHDSVTMDEYAIMTMNMGTSFVRITDPENPVVLAYMPGSAGTTRDDIFRDVKVMNDHAFVGSEAVGHGIQIFDLTRLRSMVEPTEMVAPDVHYKDIGNSHNLVVGNGTNFLYVVGATEGANTCLGGPYILSVTDPKNPVFVGCFGADNYTHDAQCLIYSGPDLRYKGREICFNFNEEELVIVDVTDKLNMQILSKENYEGNEYTHQGWLTEGQSRLMLNDGMDEYYNYYGRQEQRTYMWDITDLTNPFIENTYWSQMDTIDHNLYILGKNVYQANFESGLRIQWMDPRNQNPPTMKEVAYFDVHPEPTNVEFVGMWTAYPYLPSGNIVASSTDRGLFILLANVPAIEEKIQNSQTIRERSQTRPILWASDTDSCPVTTRVEQEIVDREC